MHKRPVRCILRVQGCHHPSYVKVCWEVSHQGVTHLHFCKKGVKLVSECIKRTYYRGLWNSLTLNLLTTTIVAPPSNASKWQMGINSAFKGLIWPLHWSGMVLPAGLNSCPKAKTTQEWLRRNLPAFISVEVWPTGSPDLNPRNYKLWAVLKDTVC
jgi:hypothetical protein